MKDSVRNAVIFAMLTVMSIGSAGCYQMTRSSQHDKAVKKFPTYAQTKAAWGAVPEGYGRVVIFFPRDIESWLSPGGSGYTVIWIIVDKLPETPVVDQTFVFIDLPAGEHPVRLGGSVVYGPKLEFEVKPGEIKYINPNLKLVPGNEAEPLLKNIRHSYQEAIPYDKQSKFADCVYSHL